MTDPRNSAFAPLRAIRPMRARDPAEGRRAATPLELLFDLVSVIAIAFAATGLHHAIAEGHAAEGVVRFLMAFFAIWWAWMNFTWFASAYDNDDAVFRLLTMAIMAGALCMAVGIKALFATLDLDLVIAGYVAMRAAMIALWLRAAAHDPARRGAALRYALGIAVAQVWWTLALGLFRPHDPLLFHLFFLLGAALELAVPAFAERRSVTPWHRGHMTERYGLLVIIVMGETLLACAAALGEAAAAGAGHGGGGGGLDPELALVALSALATLFAMWWLYFTRDAQLTDRALTGALTWGYGHAAIFASGAATGAGFAVLVDVATHHSRASVLTGTLAVAIPVAIWLAALWLVRDRLRFAGPARWALPGAAALTLLAGFTPAGLVGVALVTVLCVPIRAALARREPGAPASSAPPAPAHD